MIQNLKIDIIYYNTPSDFEFEFNLGGCCNSRILNNRTSSPKELLEGLSKAVSRSRVILVIGKIGEGDGLVSLISRAVGIPTVQANTDEYGIDSPENPEILKNSLPLVSKDGILSGCIVESGPQSIILISDNKSIRKDVSQNLVFPYITALSRTPETDNLIKSEDSDANQETVEDIPVIEQDTQQALLEEESETAEFTIEEQSEEINGTAEEFGPEEETEPYKEDNCGNAEEVYAQESDENIIFSNLPDNEDSKHSEIPPVIDENYILSSNTDSEEIYNQTADYDSDSSTKKPKKPISGLTVAILILCGVLFIVAAVLLYMLVYQPVTSSIPVLEYIKDVFNFS